MDPVLKDAAKILRLLHLTNLRKLQSDINNTIELVQNVTANPKTDTKSGKVGRWNKLGNFETLKHWFFFKEFLNLVLTVAFDQKGRVIIVEFFHVFLKSIKSIKNGKIFKLKTG